ncbi:plasmid mobilization relaxosome protein MobC [Qipengyuania sp. XHP0207]|uniref:plasmid mobilization protein n=1 Tax=Qipengyuania sp. XHP0207 TaxID=3038078 RepID=UPI00241F2D27|nr:plasmid mobilization relaxosome protein MobC [Qipengyuania sp. XHP0207]MDG5749313.1 plasmid mobilization relaxosome protein MobC [Qipengyuania sp. XHP0207]
MPGQPGSETRFRNHVRTTRWSDQEFEYLQNLAAYSGCSVSELLRRLVVRADRQIIISRGLVHQVTKLGTNVNQIAKKLNSEQPVSADELTAAYQQLLKAVNIARS